MTKEWKPRIVAFFCNWCTYTAADLAGVSRLKYAANIRVIRLMCSGRVDPQFILDAWPRAPTACSSAAAIPGDCHYVEGNYKMLRRFQMLKRMLKDLGIEDERVRLEWISAAEGEKVKRVVNEMVGQVQKLGPLGMPQKFEEWDKEMEHFAAQVAAKEAASACACADARPARCPSQQDGGCSCLNPKSPSTGAPRAEAAKRPSSTWPRTSSASSRRWTSSSGPWRWTSSTRTSRRCRTSPSPPRCSTAPSAPPSRRRWPTCCAARASS